MSGEVSHTSPHQILVQDSEHGFGMLTCAGCPWMESFPWGINLKKLKLYSIDHLALNFLTDPPNQMHYEEP